MFKLKHSYNDIIKDTFGGGSGGTVRALFDPLDFAGTGAAEQAKKASKQQQAAIAQALAATEAATEQGLGFLNPFSSVGREGLGQVDFLTDPNAQFDFLQNNPLFQLALDNANTETNKFAASKSRLSAGDTLQQLSNNVLLSASPLIRDQKNSIGDLLNFGSGIATTQANTAINQGSNVSDLITTSGDVAAAGTIGASNARSQGSQNIAQALAAFFGSDERLKKNKKKIGKQNGFNVYSWTWNKLAESLGYFGDSFGVMAQEVLKVKPEAVAVKDGYLAVNYQMIGVDHGN